MTRKYSEEEVAVLLRDAHREGRDAAVAATNGLVNVFALSESQLAQMSPATVRAHFDKILEHARSQSGAPPVPQPPKKAGGK